MADENFVTDQQIMDLSTAIARAEGFGILNTVPTRANNPGDIKLQGYPTIGAENISVFPTLEEGWEALHHQLYRIKMDQSHIYNSSMTFSEFAHKWTDTAQSSWLETVLEVLRNLGYAVAEDVILDDFFSGRTK